MLTSIGIDAPEAHPQRCGVVLHGNVFVTIALELGINSTAKHWSDLVIAKKDT